MEDIGFTYCHICKEVVEINGDECSECGAYLGED